jgi:hypothetical protein
MLGCRESLPHKFGGLGVHPTASPNGRGFALRRFPDRSTHGRTAPQRDWRAAAFTVNPMHARRRGSCCAARRPTQVVDYSRLLHRFERTSMPMASPPSGKPLEARVSIGIWSWQLRYGNSVTVPPNFGGSRTEYAAGNGQIANSNPVVPGPVQRAPRGDRTGRSDQVAER